MPWLKYEVDEDDPEAMAEWEAEVAQIEPAKEGEEQKEAPPKPELQHVEKTMELQGEARLQVVTESGYQNLALGAGGVTLIEWLDEDPNPAPPEVPATQSASKSSKSS